MRKWSPTMINATKRCKRNFEKKFIEEAPGEVIIPEFEEGNRYHEIAENYLITGNESYLVNLNDAVKETLKMIKGWAGHLYIEREFEDEKIIGVADIMFRDNSKWIIIDIKSRYDNEIKQDDYIQLYTYAYFAQQIEELPNILIGILALHNQINPLNLIESQLVTLEDLKQYVNNQIENAEKRMKHMRNNTAYCKYCEYVISCDVIPEKPVTIEEMGQRYLQLKQLLNQYEIILKEHVNLTGKNIIIDDMEIGMHIKNITKVDDIILVNIARENNIPLHTIYKPDITAIKKLAKKVPDIYNALHIEQDYYFTTKKITNNED